MEITVEKPSTSNLHTVKRGGGDPAGLLIWDLGTGLAIIPQQQGDGPSCQEINEQPTAVITILLMMFSLLWHALVELDDNILRLEKQACDPKVGGSNSRKEKWEVKEIRANHSLNNYCQDTPEQGT